ncbi:MAG: DUF1772 domain-containing protein [Chloroflexota bacterium]
MEVIFQTSLLVATLFCALATGFTLLFAIVVMPGIGALENDAFLQAFQTMDQVIQKNQPLFIFVWVGSAVFLLIAAVLGFGQLAGMERFLLVGITAVYLLGVQLPTILINIPLNNRIQTLTIETLSIENQAAERQRFESRWNRWNRIRTAIGCVVSVVLLVLMLWL